MHSVFHLVIALFCFNCRGGNHTAQEDWLLSYHWLVGFIGWVLCAWLELFTHTSSGNVWFWLCLSCSDLSQTHWPLRLCSFFAARVTLGPLTGASRSTLPLLHPLAYLLHLTSSSGETTAHSLLHQLHTFFFFFFFLRRLKVFGASQNIMFLFYQAVTESVIRYWMTVWFGSLSTQSKSKLQRLVQTVMKVMWRTDRLSLLVHLWAVCTQAGTEGIVRPVPHPSNGIRALAFRQKVQNPQRQIEPF